MSPTIRAPKEFWMGLLYLALGGAGILIAQHYPFGTASRMGPGYLPSLVCGLLMLFGVISLVRAVRLTGEPIGEIAFKPLFLVLLSVFAFAALSLRAGLVIAIIALVLISAAGSRYFTFSWKAMAGMLVLVAFCSLIFVRGLGVPLPLIGTWFTG
ncbi:hypothetical protein GCM10007276_28010 [Agaricicola taiwanensis]|uniref:DUF1468 domain-containing protein n=1 Tax=Agaricicola taiwanensis TaxID=591372 RepID=A0A8J2YJV9_9RHOB|nr:tripartite tricarboxylate transporter TctB family protein [Agaricicola taiwanensis]GGE49277.1 hypothetical protein GCM10007276_28010 [Agaricicola taiwanensis]